MQAELEVLHRQCAEERIRVQGLTEENFQLNSARVAADEQHRLDRQEFVSEKETLYADTVQSIPGALWLTMVAAGESAERCARGESINEPPDGETA